MNASTWLTEIDLAERYQVSRRTIQAWRYRKMFPEPVRFGSTPRWSLESIHEFENQKAAEQEQRATNRSSRRGRPRKETANA